MRNRILGAIGVLWGGAILLMPLFGNQHDVGSAAGPYAAGKSVGITFGTVMLIVGMYYVIKGDKKTTK